MNRFAGTGTLLRLALRRDRVLVPAWVLLFALMTVSSASATMALYPSLESREAAARAINDVPTFVALYGRIWDPTSLGELSMIKLTGLGTVFISILAIMLVTRHARADEEAGRTELVESYPVGAWAYVTSAFLLASITVGAIALLSGIGLTFVGLPVAGSVAFGLAWAGTGLVFAAVACLASQVTVSGRLANALSLLALALAYVVRGVGDATGSATGPSAWSWLSPIGWAQQVRAFADNQYWPILLCLGGALVIALLALVIDERRDIGAGLITERPGPPRAGRLLGSPWGLAWHQQRWLLVTWAIAYVAFGWLIGSIVSDLGSFLSSPEATGFIASLGGTQRLVDAFIALEFGLLAFATSAYGITVVRRVSTEEASGHAELVFSASVRRFSYLSSHMLIAFAGTTVLTVVQGVSFAAADALHTGNATAVWSTVGAATTWLPAIWVMTAVTVLLVGIDARLASLAWLALVAVVLISELGAVLSWPDWILDASPFAHIPLLPGEPMNWAALAWLCVIALALACVGTVRYERRDLAG